MTKRRAKIITAIVSIAFLANPVLFTGAPFTFVARAVTGFTVSGTVLLPNGSPSPNTPVGIRTNDWSFNRWMGTQSDGTFSFSDVPAGNYFLESNPMSGVTGLTNALSQPFTVSNADVTGLSTSLVAAPKTISGTVTKADGTPVVGANVNANKFDGMGNAGTRTDANGAYTIYVSGGHYAIFVNPDNSPGAPAADWIFTGQAPEVNFASDSTAETQTINISVTSAKATVVVTVIKTDGTPITTGQVDVRSNDGRGNGQPLNNTNVVTLKVPSGSYFVNYFSQDNRYSVTPQSINAVDDTTTNVTLTAKEKTAHVTGKAIDVNGVGLPNIRLNVNCQPLGTNNMMGGTPGSFSNGTSQADGTFDILTTAGQCHLNIDQNPNMMDQSAASYIYSGQPIDPVVSSDTASVDVGSITLQLADATITGRILDDTGSPIGQMNGSAFARPVQSVSGGPSNEFNGPINNGRYTIKLPSKVFSVVQLGVHLPQNMQYSTKDSPTITVIANSTITQDITLVRNTSSIYGSVVTPDGIPLTACNPAGNAQFFGQVFVNSPTGGYGTLIKPDCSYEVSVGTGTYQFGYNLDPNSGFMNRPPSPDPVVVKDNDRVVRNIIVVASDAKIRVTVLDPKGNKVPNVWVGADNHEEIVGGPLGDTGQKREGPKGMEDQKGPGGLSDPQSIMKYCLDPKHKTECVNDKLPAGTKGPGACTNAYECSTFCSKPANQAECGKFFGGTNQPGTNQPGGPQPGQPQTGPGGCKTETECKTYCSDPAHASECSKFAPPPGTTTGAAFLPGKVKGETTDKEIGMNQDNFDKQIFSGSQTDFNGNATVAVVSGHKYTVNNGLPPDSPYMQAAMQRCDLTTAKTCDLVMILRTSDVTVTGTVRIGSMAVTNGFVHAWSENGGFSGTPVNNGSYKLNLSSGTTWHIGADSPQGRDFYRGNEVLLVTGTPGKYSQNFQLSKNIVQLPDPVSMSFDATTQAVLALRDGTTVTMPANSIATSGSVTVTATPTIQINTTQTDQPAFGFGYEFKAIQNGAEITKFAASTVSVQFKYDVDILNKLGISEKSLIPKYYNATSGAWEQPGNILQDTTNKTLTVTGLSHFSIHSVVSTAGVSASKTNLTTVSTSKARNGETQITVGLGKAFSPFKGFVGSVNIATANLGGTTGQIIVAAQGSAGKTPSKVMVYKVVSNKKNATNVGTLRELVPFPTNKGGLNLSLSDITQDGHEDIILSTVNGNGDIRVFDVANKFRNWTMKIGDAKFKGSTTIAVLEAYVKGQGSLVAKAGSDIAVFSYNAKVAKFGRDSKYPVSKKVNATSMTLNDLRPTVTSAVSTAFTTNTSKVVGLVIKGSNFTKDTKVLINGKLVTIKYVNATTLSVFVKPSLYKKGGVYRFQISNSEGTTTSGRITFK